MKQIRASTETPYPKIKFSLSWLIVVPAGLWVLITYYLPVMGGTLNQLESQLVTPIVILLIGFSLFCHVSAHLLARRWMRAVMPSEVRISIFGDASQY